MRMDKHIVRRAMAGDEDAQQACTEAGEALPCHACGGECKHIDDEAFGDIVICQKAGCSGGQHVFYPNAHEALTAHNTRAKLQEEPNEALTLEELREMGGQPVWVEYDQDKGCWGLVRHYERKCVTVNEEWDEDFLFFHYAKDCGGFVDRAGWGEKRWLAYRSPPEEQMTRKLKSADVQGIDDAHDASAQVTSKLNGWIPCNEQMPGHGAYNDWRTHVLLLSGDCVLEGYLTKNGNWSRTNGATMRDLPEVTHWMPLPAPPEIQSIPTNNDDKNVKRGLHSCKEAEDGQAD